jgi:hypothetical protein
VDGNDEDVYHNVDTYVKDLIKKLKFNKYNFESKYNRGQSKIIIQKVTKAEKQNMFVTNFISSSFLLGDFCFT